MLLVTTIAYRVWKLSQHVLTYVKLKLKLMRNLLAFTDHSGLGLHRSEVLRIHLYTGSICLGIPLGYKLEFILVHRIEFTSKIG